MGEKDDYTPAAQCITYVERLKSGGAKVDSKIYPGAYHGWISDAKNVVYLPRVQVFSKCDMRIDDVGVIRELGSGANTLQGWSAFVSNVWKTCGKSGANYGANESAKQSSLLDMVSFFSPILLRR
jgi:dienelactone hydrolase